MNQPSVIPIRNWGTLASSVETTDLGTGKLTRAVNCILRPFGAVKGIPRYFRLWAIGSASTVQATMRALPFTGYPGGVGADSTARNANKTIAVRIYRQGKNFLFFYDLINSKARGLFYMGDDGTYTSGTYDFTAGTPSYEVLAVGLDAAARWFGRRMGPMLKISNNVDSPVCVQLNRTTTPGKWRLAASNVAPGDPVISKVPAASQLNTQAYYTISGSAAIRILPDPSNESFYTYSAVADIASVSTTGDRITISGFTPTEGQSFTVAGGTAPGGLTNYNFYIMRNVSGTTFQVSLTLTGSIINLTSAGTGTKVFKRLTQNLAEDTPVTLASSGTLPTGLSAGTYYLADVNSVQVRLSSSPGGSAVPFSDVGVTISDHTITPVGSVVRAGGVALTFTADTLAFPGASGNSKIQVAIQYSSYTSTITSTRTGTGTTTDPYLYTIITGNTAGSSSNDAIVAYVNSDTLAVGILEASTAVANATADTGSWAAEFLLNGVGAGTSDGLTNQTCTVYLRYWDPGISRVGYEGVSSEKSNEIILTDTENSDILVTIPTDPSAEGGRFGFIRVYFQFGEGAAAIWNLVGQVANTSGTKTLQIGTNTVIGQGMSADQNRPLAFKAVCFVQNQVWHGGSTTTPDLLYISKTATDDEIAPEGASILDPFLIVLPEQTSDFKITALDTDDYRLHVHTSQGVILLDPQNPDENRHIPQVPVGALNPACLVKWEKSKIYYLGSDMAIYEFDGARYGRRNVSSATKEAQLYILDRANLDRVSREPDRVNAWLDVRSELLFYHFPAGDNTLNGFIYDFKNTGVVGELTYPKVYDQAEMEPERTERIFTDEEGNLFVMNSLDQEDWGDALTASPIFTPYSTSTTPPIQFNGYGYVDYNGKRYYQAVETLIETGFIDLNDPTKYKAFMGGLWTTIQNSRALVEVTFTNKSGRSVTRQYGDIGSKGHNQIHKVAASLGGEAVKVKLRIISAEQAGWVFRNFSLMYRAAGMF